jgi:predicted MPP superfamily phosphohydrolase
MSSKATFLHLSDFHFAEETETEWESKLHPFSLFKEDIIGWQHRKNQKIDSILITGDIANSGQTNEYIFASNRFQEILKVTGVAIENVFFVPGNHDANRNEMTRPEEETIKSILEGNSDVNEYFRRYEDYRIFLDKFKPYVEFLETIKCPNKWGINKFGKPKPWYSIRKCIGGVFCQIVGLTTSLFIGKNEDVYGKIRLGARQLQECLYPVKGDEVVIMLAHHPIDWFYSEEQTYLQTLVGQNRALYLHGHSHKYRIENRNLFDLQLTSVGAGCGYSRSDKPNRYHILQLDLDKRRIFVWPRKWYPEAHVWRADNEWQKLNKDGSSAKRLRRPPILEEKALFTVEASNPYWLGKRRLSLREFPDVLENTTDEKGEINLAIVVGSGRYKEADHVSYGTDCIGLPEVTSLLANTNKPKTNITSCLDIDIFNTKDIEDKNLLLLGSGKVNYVTMKLLDQFGSILEFQFNHPHYTTLKSNSSGKTYLDGDQDDWGLGILCLMHNPWAAKMQKQRVIVLIAGFHPLGSLAANCLLREYITSVSARENNTFEDSIPMKIVRGRRLEFNEYVKRTPDIIERPLKNRTYIGSLGDEPEIVE